MSTAVIFLGLSASVAGHTLLVHYSRQQPGPKYPTSTVVLLTEALKLIAGLVMLLITQENIARTLYEDIVRNPRDVLKTCVPSLLYALQNNLVLVSLTNLDAATFLVTSQLKIFFTAFFMWFLMGRTFSKQRCFSMALLCAGEILVHWETISSVAILTGGQQSDRGAAGDCVDTRSFAYSSCEDHPLVIPWQPRKLDDEEEMEGNECGLVDLLDNATCKVSLFRPAITDLVYDNHTSDSNSYLLGLSTALLTCVGSGFAGVYLEIVLKNSPRCSFWIRNVQLYIWGIISNGIVVIMISQGIDQSPFNGFNEITLLIVATSALVGFCTAFIIQRLDNIWKNLASSASVVMATFVSALFFGTPIGFTSTLGTILVIAVPFLYHTG